MWSRCYRRHVIMAFPSFDTMTNSWAPQADISWPTGPQRDSEFVRFPIRVMTEREAVACALRNGKSWIDNRLKATQDIAARKNGAAGRIKPRRASEADAIRKTKPAR